MKEGERSVTAAIKERKVSNSQPGYREDGRRIGLVIQGGGMSAAVSGGETQGIGLLGLLKTFDAIFGVSAGAAAGAYLLGEGENAASVFYEVINNQLFINPWRILRGEPIMDVPWLTYKMMKEIRPLNWEKIVDNPISLHVYVTSAKDARTVDFTNFKTQEEILDALHWACRIPIIAGPPIRIDDQTYYTDGGVTTGGGIPLEEAIADGCTHILVLQSEPDGVINSPEPSVYDLLGYFLLKPEFPALARALLKKRIVYVRNLQKILEAEKNPTQYPQAIEGVRLPAGSAEVAFLEIDKYRLRRGVRQGRAATIRKFRSNYLTSSKK